MAKAMAGPSGPLGPGGSVGDALRELLQAARAARGLPPLEPRPEAPRVRRYKEIRAIGCHLLFQYGYAGMTMRQIASRMRIKAASLYHHFPSKQIILFDLMEKTVTELLEGLRRIVESDEGPAEQLEAAVRWHVLFHTQKREEAFVSHSEMRSLEPHFLEKILKLRDEYDRLFDSILLRGKRQGVFETGDVSVVRNAILTMCTATGSWFSPEGRLTADQVAEQICAFVRAAVMKRNGGRGARA